MANVQIKWLGCAGFEIKSAEHSIAFDPFLSRGDRPEAQRYSVSNLANVRDILVGHGHFDHVFDIPAISHGSEARIWASSDTLQRFKHKGVSPDKLCESTDDGQELFPGVRAFASRHIQFDLPLVATTLGRLGIKGCIHIAGLGMKYPMGGVRSYLMTTSGKKILFLSSATQSQEELARYRYFEPDILMVPVQGHSKIQSIAADIAKKVQPKLVIPHHHDDFYPPMSKEISLEPLKQQLRGERFSWVELKMFEEAIL